jgi:tetratricopeptide (TPR) repeat protein
VSRGQSHWRWSISSSAPPVILLVQFIVIVAWKFNAEQALLPRIFKEESALQYRYAKLVAQRQPIPEYDMQVQYPEGIRPHEDLPLFMEYLTGLAVRGWLVIRPGTTLDESLIGVKGLVSTASILACYAASSCIFQSRWSGLVAAILFGLSYASVYRLPESFGHEHFALPLLFGGFAALVASLFGRSVLVRSAASCVAASLWVVGLLTWHFSRFFLFGETIALAGLVILGSIQTIKHLRAALVVITGFMVVASLSTPHLHATGFLASVTFLCFIALLVSTSLLLRWGGADDDVRLSRRHLARCLICFVALALACAVAATLARTGSLYEHVWDLLVAQVRNVGHKPEDPSGLSFDARVLWSGSFHGASLGWVVWSMWAALLACLVTLSTVFFRRAYLEDRYRRDGLILLGLNAAMYLVSVFLAERMAVMALFFFAVLGGGSMVMLVGRRTQTAAFLVLTSVVSVLVANYPGLNGRLAWLKLSAPQPALTAAERYEPVSQVDFSLVYWIRTNTPVNATFLGRFNVLPPVLAYAERPIALHCKLEIPGVRAKVREHLGAVFGSEAALAEYCDRQGATYYLYDPFTALDTGSDSSRYIAGVRQLHRSSAAYLLHFAPDRLRYFELVFQNEMYRVYRRTDHPAVYDSNRFPYQPIFEIDHFEMGGGESSVEAGSSEFSDAQTDRVFLEQQHGTELLRRAVHLFSLGRWPQALSCYDAALCINPSLPYAHSHRARILLHLGRLDEALREAQQATWVDPYEPEGYFHLALVQAIQGDHESARRSLQTCQRLSPRFPGVAEMMSRL